MATDPLVLYPFRYFDPVRNRWIKARYVATKEEIAARHEQWEIVGAPELRTANATMFGLPPIFAPRPSQTPVKEPPPKDTPPKTPPIKEPPTKEPPVNEPPATPTSDPPALDDLERLLVLLFLRRYIMWCARRGRFAAMEGAAKLHRQIV